MAWRRRRCRAFRLGGSYLLDDLLVGVTIVHISEEEELRWGGSVLGR
jgi:hypothetical protein